MSWCGRRKVWAARSYSTERPLTLCTTVTRQRRCRLLLTPDATGPGLVAVWTRQATANVHWITRWRGCDARPAHGFVSPPDVSFAAGPGRPASRRRWAAHCEQT